MNSLIRECLTHNLILKIVSLLLGFASWSLLSNYELENQWVEIPICFYNIPGNMKVDCAQEKIKVQIAGKSKDLAHCDANSLALHINATDFKPGKQHICPSSDQLFLPNSVKLVHYKPLFIEISSVYI